MRKKYSLVGLIAVLMVLFISLSPFVVLAQYQTEQTAPVTISSGGSAHVDQSQTTGGISIDIVGTPGATGSVSTATYSGNPQPGASGMSGIKLNHFVVVTFNIAASKFQHATITVHYTDADVAGMSTPYALYKYNPSTNAYVKLTGTLDTAAKTITYVVTSTTDPLFAIGGAIAPTPTPTPTPSPTPSPTPTPSPNPTATPNPPTTAPTAAPTKTPNSVPTNNPTTAPSTLPTETPTTEPTVPPTPAPTEEPSVSLVTWAWIFVAFECVTGAIVVIGMVYQTRPKTAK